MDEKSQEIYNKLVPLLAKQLGVEESKISESSLLADDLGADSLDTAEIAMCIQDEFGVNFKDQHIAKVKTVADIVDVLSSGLEKVA